MEVVNALGRRKTAIARVFVKEGKGTIRVNDKDYSEYFPTGVLRFTVEEPLAVVDAKNKYDIIANIDGGGFKGQAQALSLALSRALCKINPENRPALKAKDLLRRDPRMVERKKPGQKKARKRFQFSKR
jgi:small subunit ribosomal protein S9